MSRSTLILSLASLLAASSSAWASGTYYSLGTGKSASGVNADGTVVAGTATVAGAPYWMWTLNPTPTITTIGGVSPGSGVGGQARVSADGDKISGTVAMFNPLILGWPGTVVNCAGVYDVSSAAWAPLGGIGWYSGTETSGGWAISGDGHVAAALAWHPNQTTAYASLSTDLAPLVALPWEVPARSSRANGLNYDGSVAVGWHDNPSGFRQGTVWINGVIQRLWKSYPLEPLSEANAASADGTWVVGNGIQGTYADAWRWSVGTGYQSLGAPPPNMRGFATGISADGTTIVGFHRTIPIGPQQGFIWTQAGGLQELTAYVAAQGVALPAGVTLLGASNISADGRTIIGIASNNESFVVRLDPPVCPADIDDSNAVDINDLLEVINNWGACVDPKNCPADVDGDDMVDINDLLEVINTWGACP